MKTKISIFLFLILLFSSCENGINHSGSEQNNSSSHTSEKSLVVVSGSLKIDNNAVHEKSTARNAIPSVPYVYSTDDDYEYFVQAISSNGLTHEVIADPENWNYYEISLEWGERWSISAGMRKKADNSIIMLDADSASGKALSFLFDNDNLYYSFNFILQPLQKAGKGRVELSMEPVPVDSVTGEAYVTELKLYITKDGSLQEWFPDLIQVSIDSSNEDNNYIKSIGTDYNIPSGSYDVTFIYYKTYTSQSPAIKLPVYITHQVINVYDNLETTEWNNFSSNYEYDIISSSGIFRLTEELIKEFAETTLYVGTPAGITAIPNDSALGTPFTPLATLDGALRTIQLKGKGTPYRIYITGSQTGNWSLPSTIDTSIATSIEIKGIGNSKSELTAAGIASVLTIDTPVPVTLENIKISDGSAENGGGINLKQGELILKNDVLIQNNTATDLGGGIYVDSTASLKISGNVVVYGNTNATNNRSNVYLPTSKKIIVLDALKNVTGNLVENAKIGINSPDTPTITTPVIFTDGYGYKTGGKNAGIVPGRYFIGDVYGVTDDGAAGNGEAILSINHGTIALEPLNEEITLEIDNKLISEENPSANVYNFTAIKNKGSADEADVTATTTFSYRVVNHGVTVPSGTNGYYTTDGTQLQFKNNMPIDNYVIVVNAQHQGRSYSASFKIADGVFLSYLTEAPTSGRYKLDSLTELEQLKTWVGQDNTFENVTFELADDIDTNGTEIVIGAANGNNTHNFMGTFDGKGYKITNTISHSYSYYDYTPALFRSLGGNGIIRNLTVAGTSKGGGIVASMTGGTIEHCISEVTITNPASSSGSKSGGIVCSISVGSSENTCIIRNCVNKGNITNTNGAYSAGGIVGFLSRTSNGGVSSLNCIIENCINKGNVSVGSGWIGGIIGYYNGWFTNSTDVTDSTCVVRNCKNTGTISYTGSSSNSISGLIGRSALGLHLINCNNLGNVVNPNSENKSAGILQGNTYAKGFDSSSYFLGTYVYNCCNSGSAVYGILTGTDETVFSLAHNYSLDTSHTSLTAASLSGQANPDYLLKAYTISEAGSIVEQLNDCNPARDLENWTPTPYNTVESYKPWKINNNGLPELDLGELDTL